MLPRMVLLGLPRTETTVKRAKTEYYQAKLPNLKTANNFFGQIHQILYLPNFPTIRYSHRKRFSCTRQSQRMLCVHMQNTMNVNIDILHFAELQHRTNFVHCTQSKGQRMHLPILIKIKLNDMTYWVCVDIGKILC